MHYIYELKKQMIDELEEHGEKNDLSRATLPEIDMLAHAAEKLCKIIDHCEKEEMSGRSYGYDPTMDRTSGKRDAMGKYSSGMDRSMDRSMARSMDGGSYGGDKNRVVEQLEQLMMTSSDDRTRGKFRELIRDMRNA